MIYSQNKRVSASMCGSDGKLSIIGSLILIEDCLTELMGELKIDGITAQTKYNANIVFVKNHIKFFKSPEWNEQVIVESFISSKSAVRFYIDTYIKNQNNEILTYSKIELCGIDHETHRIRKLDTFGIDDSITTHTPLCEIEFNKKMQNDLNFIENVLVRSSNIDYVQHTNNVEYMRFIINTMPVKELVAHPLKEMEINYVNQSFEGDVLSVFANKTEKQALFEIKKQDQSIMRCDMLFSE